jgi:hypothetical protein
MIAGEKPSGSVRIEAAQYFVKAFRPAAFEPRL